MAAKLRVAVLFGGRSGEHEVSLASAESIMRHLDPARYEVIPIGITREGRWLAGGDPLRALKAGAADGTVLTALLPDPSQRALVALGGDALATPGQVRAALANVLGGAIDVVFPVLHGTYGEDGTVQGLLELAGLPYVGSGVLGSALGMDKALMKTVFRAHGIPVVEHVGVLRSRLERAPEAVLDEVEATLSYPCFTKTANLCSSVGVSKVRTRSELLAGLREAAQYDRKVLVERGVEARELECSVLGNDEPIASVVGEVVPVHEFYDYRAKYIDEGSQLIIPADIPAAVAEEVRALAVRAFTALDCAGMARVDFFLCRRTGKLYVNELNTIPGFTSISMYPKLWEASGLPYSALLDRLIALALERHAERARNRTDYTW